MAFVVGRLGTRLHLLQLRLLMGLRHLRWRLRVWLRHVRWLRVWLHCLRLGVRLHGLRHLRLRSHHLRLRLHHLRWHVRLRVRLRCLRLRPCFNLLLLRRLRARFESRCRDGRLAIRGLRLRGWHGARFETRSRLRRLRHMLRLPRRRLCSAPLNRAAWRSVRLGLGRVLLAHWRVRLHPSRLVARFTRRDVRIAHNGRRARHAVRRWVCDS
ncbi:MAG TPA: hypothetical protein VGZ01_11415, partial [Trinickia sp.]|nr:hypothetical protein [Trinickia sp.]